MAIAMVKILGGGGGGGIVSHGNITFGSGRGRGGAIAPPNYGRGCVHD